MLDDNELVDGFLKLMVRPRFYERYRSDMLESISRSEDWDTKNRLLTIFIEEVWLLFPKTLLRYKPEEDPQPNRVTPTKPVKRPCTKCPNKKKIGKKVPL